MSKETLTKAEFDEQVASGKLPDLAKADFERRTRPGFDYSGGEGSVNRINPGDTFAFPKPESKPNVEKLEGTLNYEKSEYADAVTTARVTPELSTTEFETLLDSQITQADLKGFRREINIEIARSASGTPELIKDVRLAMTGLRPNDENSKECMRLIKEMIVSGRDYELPEHFALPVEQKKVKS